MGKLRENTTITQKAKDENASNADSLIISTDLQQTSRLSVSAPTVNGSDGGGCYEHDGSPSAPGDVVLQIASAMPTQTLSSVSLQQASCQVSPILFQKNSPGPNVTDATTPQQNYLGSHKVAESVSREIFNKPGYIGLPGAEVISPSSVQDVPTSAHRQVSSPALERVSSSQTQPISFPNNRIQISVPSSVSSSVTETQQSTKSCQVDASKSVESCQALSFPAKSSERVLNMNQSLSKQQESEILENSFCTDNENSGLNCVHNDTEIVHKCKSAENEVRCDSLTGNKGDNGRLKGLNSANCGYSREINLESLSDVSDACQSQPQMNSSKDDENKQKKKYKERIFAGEANIRKSGLKGGCNICRKEMRLLKKEGMRWHRNLPILRVRLKRLDPTLLSLKPPLLQKRKVGRPKGSKKSASEMLPRPYLEHCGLSKSPEASRFSAKKILHDYLVKKRLIGLSSEERTLSQDNSVLSSKTIGTDYHRKIDFLENRECISQVDQNFTTETKRKNISQADSGSELTGDASMDAVSSRTQEAVSKSDDAADTDNTGTRHLEKTCEEQQQRLELLNFLDQRMGRKDGRRNLRGGLNSAKNGGCQHLQKSISWGWGDKEMVEKFRETESEYDLDSGQRKRSKRLQDDVKQIKGAFLQTALSQTRQGKKVKCSSSCVEGPGMAEKGKSCSEINVLSKNLEKRSCKKRVAEVIKTESPSLSTERTKRPYKKRITEVMKLKVGSKEESLLKKCQSHVEEIENPKGDIMGEDISRNEQPVAKKVKYVKSNNCFMAEGKEKLVKEALNNKRVNDISFCTQGKTTILKNSEQNLLLVGENVVKKKRGRPPKRKPHEEELSAKMRKGNCGEPCTDSVLSKSVGGTFSVSHSESYKKGASSSDELSGKMKDREGCKEQMKKKYQDKSGVREIKKRGPYKKKKEKDPSQSLHKDWRQEKELQLCKKSLNNFLSTSSGTSCITKQRASGRQEGKTLCSGNLSQTSVQQHSQKQRKMNSYLYQAAQLQRPRSNTKDQTVLPKQSKGKSKTKSSVARKNFAASSAAYFDVRTNTKQSGSSESNAVRLANESLSVMNQRTGKPKQKRRMTAKWKRYLDKLKKAAAQRHVAITSAAVNKQGRKRGPLKKRGQADIEGSDETKVKTQGLCINKKRVKSETVTIEKPYVPAATYKTTKVSHAKSMNGSVNKNKAKMQRKQLIEFRLRLMKEGKERKAARREEKRLQMWHLSKLKKAAAVKGRDKMPESSVKSKCGMKDKATLLRRCKGRELRGKHVLMKTNARKNLKKHRLKSHSTHLKLGKTKVPTSSPVIEIERDPSFNDENFSCPDSLATKDEGECEPKLFALHSPVSASSLVYQLRTFSSCDLNHFCCQKSRAAKVDASTQWEDPLPLYSALMYRDMFSLARRDSGAKMAEEWTEENLLGSLMNLVGQENSFLNHRESPTRAHQQFLKTPPSLSCESWKNSSLLQSSGAYTSVQTPVSQRRASLLRTESPHNIYVQKANSYNSYTVVKTQQHTTKHKETSSNDELCDPDWKYTPETNAVEGQLVETNADEEQQEDCDENISCPVICSVGYVSEEDFSQANMTDANSLCGRGSQHLLGMSPDNVLTYPCVNSSGDNHDNGDNSPNFSKGQAPYFRYIDEKPESQGQGLRQNRFECCKNNPQSMKKQNERKVETHFGACDASSANEKADQDGLDRAAMSTTSLIVVSSDDSEDDEETYHANMGVIAQSVQNTSLTDKLKTSRLLVQPERNGLGQQIGRSDNRDGDCMRSMEDQTNSAFSFSCCHPGCENQSPQEFSAEDSSEHFDDPFKNVMVFVHDEGQNFDYPNKDLA